MLNKISVFFCCLAACCCLDTASFATPIIYENPILIPNSSASDSVVGTGLVTDNGFETPESWDYWLLAGNAGDLVEVTVNRIDSDLDPVFGIWDGIEFDTTDFVDLFSDSTSRTLLVVADDEIPHPGPFGDPQATVFFPTPAIYIIGVADHGATGNPVLPELEYEIAVRLVPEPSTLVLTGCVALAASFGLRGRRSS